MGDNLERWVNKLKGLKLPSMALTMQRVPQLLDSPNTSNADYQRIISRDPGFTLAIFRSFSEHKFAPKEPPSNLAHAIALLGLGPLEDASNSLPILKETVNGRARVELYDCYSRAGHGAWYAYSLARYCNDRNPEEMAIAALLHELAEMMLWAHAKEEMDTILELQSRGHSRDGAALEVLGFTLDQLTAALAAEWRLPSLAIDALSALGAFQKRSLGVMICSSLARESALSWASDETQELVEIAAEYQKRDLDQTRAAIHRVTAKAARDLSGLPIPLAAYDLLQLEPAKKQADNTAQLSRMEERVQRNNKNRAKNTESKSEPQKTAPDTRLRVAKQRAREKSKALKQNVQADQAIDTGGQPLSKQSAGLSKLKKPPASGANNLQKLIQKTFKSLREDIELERIVFATVAADKKTVKAKFVVGASATSPLRGFKFTLGERNLFSVLMKKPQSFWFNTNNMEKYQQLIPGTLSSAVHSEGFFVASIFVKGKQVGLVYGDNKDESSLTPDRFARFKTIAQQLSNRLAGLPQ